MSVVDHVADEASIIQRIFDHIDTGTTDLGDASWEEPVANYQDAGRLEAELRVLRSHPVPFCTSTALAERGDFVARDAAGTALLAVRGLDGAVRVFRNACRHRGMALACGEGSTRSFQCRYHGWSYALDGGLRSVPHEHGFPGLDKGASGLVEVPSHERFGIVFVNQEGTDAVAPELDCVDELIPSGNAHLASSERIVACHWKVFMESFLEGYHIRTTHAATFYPVQYDNLNVVETYGRGARITFPYRAIEKLRSVEPAARRARGKLTFVYHFFPNTIVATFPGSVFLAVLEPIDLTSTRLLTYVTAPASAEALNTRKPRAGEHKRGFDLVDFGTAEDREMAEGIQRGLASGANGVFRYGLFEQAIVHFHRNLHAALEEVAASSGAQP